MPINLLSLSERAPLWIDEGEYERLVNKTDGGWSRCDDEREWLAKLHYLRVGFKAGRLERSRFIERESRLVLSWLRRQS